MRLLTLYTEAYQENSPQSNVLSQFDYAYNAAGNITQWTRQAGAGAPLRYDLGYDKASQLTSAVSTNTVTNAVVKQHFYGYDAAANRTSEQIDTSVSQATYNNVNALTAVSSGSGPVRFQGTLNEPGTVTVNGTAAAMTTATNFVANPVLASGTNYVSINARDGSGNSQSNIYKVVVDAGSGRTLGYDAVGSLTNNGAGQTYEWDAAKHLVAINYASGPVARTEFTYDGLGQRVKLVEKDSNGTPTSTKQFIWSPGDPQPSEERDASNTVTKRFYPQGEQIAGQSYYYTRDHLGSVRELTDSTGAIAAQYDYDPYGRRMKVQGTMDADFGYTGHYEHAPSGLKLTLYRAYDAELGRWISRDPIGEVGGLNLYGYVENNPISRIDPLGLWQFTAFGGSGLGGYVSFGYNSGQWNATGGAGAGAGFSWGFDMTDSGRRPCGWGAGLTAAGGIGEGAWGGSAQAQSDSNQGDSMSLGGRLGRLGGSVNGQRSPGASSTESSLSASGGATNYGASVFGGGTVSWASR